MPSRIFSQPSRQQMEQQQQQKVQERLRMKPWLRQKLEDRSIPGVEWLEKEKQTFKVPWVHAARQGWDCDKDCCLFKQWAIHTGKYNPESDSANPKTWKANFRCAINSLPDVEELSDMGIAKGQKAYKVYRFHDKKLAVKARRLSKSGGRHFSRIPRKPQTKKSVGNKDVRPTVPIGLSTNKTEKPQNSKNFPISSLKPQHRLPSTENNYFIHPTTPKENSIQLYLDNEAYSSHSPLSKDGYISPTSWSSPRQDIASPFSPAWTSSQTHNQEEDYHSDHSSSSEVLTDEEVVELIDKWAVSPDSAAIRPLPEGTQLWSANTSDQVVDQSNSTTPSGLSNNNNSCAGPVSAIGSSQQRYSTSIGSFESTSEIRPLMPMSQNYCPTAVSTTAYQGEFGIMGVNFSLNPTTTTTNSFPAVPVTMSTMTSTFNDTAVSVVSNPTVFAQVMYEPNKP